MVGYDAPTGEQPLALFACHATPEHLCHGWAVVHMSRGHAYELLGLRLWAPRALVPEPSTPLFSSGAEAAEHGKADIAEPSVEAVEAAERLRRKYGRLRDS